jgi:hypothetical protein
MPTTPPPARVPRAMPTGDKDENACGNLPAKCRRWQARAPGMPTRTRSFPTLPIGPSSPECIATPREAGHLCAQSTSTLRSSRWIVCGRVVERSPRPSR